MGRLTSLHLTPEDLRYYYFYYLSGRTRESARTEGWHIFCNIFDNFAEEIVLRILRREIKKLRFADNGEKIFYAVLRRFYPERQRIGRIVSKWNEKSIEALVPKRSQSKVRWYFVHCVIAKGEGDSYKERDVRSKSFRASLSKEAEKKGKEFVADLGSKLQPIERIIDAAIFYSNRHRGSFSLPGTDSNLLINPSLAP